MSGNPNAPRDQASTSSSTKYGSLSLQIPQPTPSSILCEVSTSSQETSASSIQNENSLSLPSRENMLSPTEIEESSPQTRTKPTWDFQDSIEDLLQEAKERDIRIKQFTITLQEQHAQLAECRRQSALLEPVRDTMREVQRSLLMELGATKRYGSTTDEN